MKIGGGGGGGKRIPHFMIERCAGDREPFGSFLHAHEKNQVFSRHDSVSPIMMPLSRNARKPVFGIFRKWPETGNYGFRKKRHCTIRVANTKALISFAAKLICAFVFAYAKVVFSCRGTCKLTLGQFYLALLDY